MKLSVLSAFASIILLTACSQPAAPVTHYGVQKGAGSAGIHTVSSGENLWTISQRYNIVMRDIAAANDLNPPFLLRDGQRLKLPPPREYYVRAGDTVYTVSRLFSVSPSELSKLNRLEPPYKIITGQVLRLPSITAKTQRIANNNDAGITPANKPNIVAGESVKPTKKPELSPAKKAENIRIAKAKKTVREKLSVKTPKRSSSKFLKPVKGRVVSSYGPKSDGLHNDGINIAAPRGTTVAAAENGVVVYAGNGLKGSGNLVLVRHDNRWMTAYGHLDKINVRNGATLTRGQSLGTVGSTGGVKTPQLHFEVRRGTEALNPKPYLES